MLTHKHRLALDNDVKADGSIDIELLKRRSLLKTLSLRLAEDAGVNTPPFLLLLTEGTNAIQTFASDWNLPLMVRIDYTKSSKYKPIGGIPIQKVETMQRLQKTLCQNGCYSLWHPHFDRLNDLYSVGVVLRREDYEAEIEIVGPGFDAGDLRRGLTNPHEVWTVDMLDESEKRKMCISEDGYLLSRETRLKTRKQLHAYTEYANATGSLVGSFEELPDSKSDDVEGSDIVPASYGPLPKSMRRELYDLVWRVRTGVIMHLPKSVVYVASLSFLPNEGWVLWDVYGSWYSR